MQDASQTLLFVSARGGPLHPNNVSLLVLPLPVPGGDPQSGACHLFRHAAASLMLDRRADIRHLQEILGHASLATTQIYTHVSIGKLCEVHARTHPGALAKMCPGRQAPARPLAPTAGGGQADPAAVAPARADLVARGPARPPGGRKFASHPPPDRVQ